MNILIRNLPRRVTETELRQLFTPYGEITALNIVMDPQTRTSKGFGFVEMPEVKQAKAAIHGLNGKKIDGQAIRVKSTLARKK
ncbi:RNA recognition motif domain-containing protein [Spirochaeta africana]|uniref:RRM domain-containing RNA-binding protein n=1 Tax=Spirochaeta africana (strain ATCC 700263 / DSM 8902 / Z-7692) TaxID=889378 RepID=H9UL21_SPIAZ|nr:RNA-binding protein [Spirochaeta africana]AFG38214.1 RRM domain-containing RNA-binding protein [Spirochaeta africana DSM 8902]